MDKKIVIIFTLLIAVLLGGGIFLTQKVQTPQITGLDDFAKCLAEKNVTMYGAAWCPHCQNEKKNFGASFQYVPYVECPQETQKCIDLKIEGYPTWIMQDGKRLVGEQGIQKLSQESGCAL